MARLINAANPSEVALTSCGTEADNWAITGVVMAARRKAAAGSSNGSSNGNGNGHASSAALPHVVTSCIEHPAVLACLNYLKQQVGARCKVQGAGVMSRSALTAVHMDTDMHTHA